MSQLIARHPRMFAILAAMLLALAAVAVIGVRAQAAAPGAVGCINAKDPHHNVKVFWEPNRVCPAGHYGISDAFTVQSAPAATAATVTAPAPAMNAVRIIEKTFTVTADTDQVVLPLPEHSWVVKAGYDVPAGTRKPAITVPTAGVVGLGDVLDPGKDATKLTFAVGQGTLTGTESKSVTVWAVVVVR